MKEYFCYKNSNLLPIEELQTKSIKGSLTRDIILDKRVSKDKKNWIIKRKPYILAKKNYYDISCKDSTSRCCQPMLNE